MRKTNIPSKAKSEVLLSEDLETNEIGVLGLKPPRALGTDAQAAFFTFPLANKRLGRYQLLEAIGEGSMGEVFVARDPYLDRLVAIKVL